MQTEILKSPTDQIKEQAEQDKNAQAMSIGGLLQVNEEISGYKIVNRMATASGEAEIYICSRDAEQFVLKYYYTTRPKAEVIEKLKTFRHSDIVSLIEYGDYRDRFYEILEYAKGGALDEKNAEGRYKYLPVSEEDAEQIVKEVINAFDACHTAGIIHRDIKPGNLFYKNIDGSDILVGDFGISSYYETDQGMSKHLTQTSARTEGYAAPEAYSGIIGPEVDYYSLGITLWELLTAQDPFVNEKGQPLYPGQIALDTMQGKAADAILARSPGLSARMQKLIRGLLVVRHDKRWGHKEVSRFFAGEDVEVFAEIRDLPILEIAGESCASYKEIAQALMNHSEEGKNFIYKGKLIAYLIKIDQKLAERLLDDIDTFSAANQLNRGLIHVAYSLCPNLPFAVDNEKNIASLGDIISLLETDSRAIIPCLRDETRGLYTYLEVAGLKEISKKVNAVVKAVSGDSRLAPRVLVALQGNSIQPFQDGVNNDLKLETIEQLYNLPEYLRERVLLFIEMKKSFITPWIENITGKDLDLWVWKLTGQTGKLEAWGKWKYFTLFLEGKDVQGGDVFYEEKEGCKYYGYKDPIGTLPLPPIWENVRKESITGTFIVEKNGKWGVVKQDGSEIIPLQYGCLELFNEENGLYKAIEGDVYKVIDSGNTILYEGDRLSVESVPGKPFDVIYNETKLFSKELKILINAQEITVKDSNNINYVWVKEVHKTYICDGNGTIQKELPYYNFYAEGGLFLVRIGHKFGAASPDGTVLLPVEFDVLQYYAGYALLKKENVHELYRCKDGKIELLCKIQAVQDHYQFTNLEGKITANILYIVNFARDYDENGYSTTAFTDCGKLSCFDGTNFISINPEKINDLQPELRYSLKDGEVDQLLEHIDSSQLWKMINNLKKQNKIPEMNALVNSTWEYFYEKKDWETARRLLFFIRADNFENLSKTYDCYRAKIAQTLENQKDYEDAVEFYEDAIKQNPDKKDSDKHWYNWRCGDCYLELKNYKKALQHFDKSLEFEPDDAWLLNRKGDALYYLNRSKDAAASYTLAIESAKEGEGKKIFYNNRGNAYKALGLQDRANEDYREAKKYE
ncbi:tetratricopeptide repeat-containing serine/threonine-protein kinase [Treponema primitia]|uniref:protein kinase domain-containing protein n=1 Tax=Treponema primitia TaxID=88058 RepID=UPI00397F9E1C